MKSAEDLISEADYLDDKAKDWESLAVECVTDRTRKRCLWDANQCRGAATRRWQEAQAILNPKVGVIRVGGLEVEYGDDDFAGYEIPERVKALLGADAQGWV